MRRDGNGGRVHHAASPALGLRKRSKFSINKAFQQQRRSGGGRMRCGSASCVLSPPASSRCRVVAGMDSYRNAAKKGIQRHSKTPKRQGLRAQQTRTRFTRWRRYFRGTSLARPSAPRPVDPHHPHQNTQHTHSTVPHQTGLPTPLLVCSPESLLVCWLFSRF